MHADGNVLIIQYLFSSAFICVHLRTTLFSYSTFSTFAHLPSSIDCSTASSTATHRAPSRKSAMIVGFLLIAPISSNTACTNVCSYPSTCPGGHQLATYGCTPSVAMIALKPCRPGGSAQL